MRIIAVLFGLSAVLVWWQPLPVVAQSADLAVVCYLSLALRSMRRQEPPE
jgi:hypothetical protein